MKSKQALQVVVETPEFILFTAFGKNKKANITQSERYLLKTIILEKAVES